MGIVNIDIGIINMIQNHFHNSFTNTVFPLISALGNSGIVWLIIAAIMIITKKYRRWGVVLLIAMAITYVTGELILKPLIARPRPCDVLVYAHNLVLRHKHGYSFPSGHAGSSFTAATVLWKANRKWGIAAVTLASLIAFSRVFLLKHYPTDVIAGALLGFLIATLVCYLYQKSK